MSGSQPRFATLADDLTGGLDTGVAFATRGWRTLVRFAVEQASPDAPSSLIPHPSSLSCDAIVWDMETRHADEETARHIVREVCEHPSVRAAPRVYKKIDSTLRGPWLVELREVVNARAPLVTLLCPAFPAVGRTVVEGELRVHGHSLEEAGFSGTGRLRDLLQANWLGRIRFGSDIAGLGLIRRPNPKSKIQNPKSGELLLLADAETDADLDALAAYLHRLNLDDLFCGAGGLAAAWARVLIPEPAPVPPLKPIAGPIWILAGSQHAVTRAQMEVLASTSEGHVEWFAADSSDFIPRLRQIPECTTVGLCLTTAPPHLITPSFRAWAADCIAAIAAEARERGVGAFIATGGETAALLLRAMDASALEIDRELLPGIPLCHIADGPWVGTPLATKAGGFGEPEALARAVAAVRGRGGTGGP